MVHSELTAPAQQAPSQRAVGTPMRQAVKWVTQWVSFTPETIPPTPCKVLALARGLQRACDPHSHSHFPHQPGCAPTPGTWCWCELSPRCQLSVSSIAAQPLSGPPVLGLGSGFIGCWLGCRSGSQFFLWATYCLAPGMQWVGSPPPWSAQSSQGIGHCGSCRYSCQHTHTMRITAKEK